MENTTKIINIINSRISILETQLKVTKSKWEINDAIKAHDELTGSSNAWTREEGVEQLEKEEKLASQILTLKKVLWDMEKLGIKITD